MKKRIGRKCRNCGQLLTPDPRNRWHQKYCSHPACRKASKAASQQRWRKSAKGRNYFRGSANVLRVQAWRKANPGYGRNRGKISRALQDHSPPQPLAAQANTSDLTLGALQDVLSAQGSLLVGLVANFTGAALQDDIDATTRRLIGLGRQFRGMSPLTKEKSRGGDQTSAVSGAVAPSAEAVQLGGSAAGSG